MISHVLHFGRVSGSNRCTLCLSIYTHVACICIHTYIHTSIHPYIHTSIHPYIHTSIHPYIHTYIHTYIHIYICMYVHVYIIYINNYVIYICLYVGHTCACVYVLSSIVDAPRVDLPPGRFISPNASYLGQAMGPQNRTPT